MLLYSQLKYIGIDLRQEVQRDQYSSGFPGVPWGRSWKRLVSPMDGASR